MDSERPPLVDIGVNLAHRQLAGDVAGVLARGREAGVHHVVATGTSVEGSRAAAELAAAHRGVYATAGVHPHHAKETDAATPTSLRALLARPQVVAVGECGLDYDRDFSPRPVQRECFAMQLAIAAETGKPVFLHERSAHADFVAILAEHRSSLSAAVIHCFTGTGAELDAYLGMDLHVGITGWICDERRGLHLRDIVGRIAPSRLLVETDAPFLLPRTIRPRPKSRRNEPRYLPHVVETVAEATGRDYADVARDSTAAARAFFGLPD